MNKLGNLYSPAGLMKWNDWLMTITSHVDETATNKLWQFMCKIMISEYQAACY